MASTSVKHRNFIMESMQDKDVTDVAGIGPVYGKRLRSDGFDKAFVLLGQFLVLKQNEKTFTEWLRSVAWVSAHHAKSCYNCLSDWCNAFL